MQKARSPNIAEYGVNKHYPTGPYHKVAGFLVENDNCKTETNAFSQQNCPAENKDGFYLNEEMSPEWEDLDSPIRGSTSMPGHSQISLNKYVRFTNSRYLMINIQIPECRV